MTDPTPENDNEVFIGMEAEGRLRGVHTLFSQRPTVDACSKAHKAGVTHIFFGARGYELTTEDFDNLEKLRYGAIPESWIITVHVALALAHRIPAWAFSRCHVLLFHPCGIAGQLAHCDIEVKLEDFRTACVYSKPQHIPLDYVYDRNVP